MANEKSTPLGVLFSPYKRLAFKLPTSNRRTGCIDAITAKKNTEQEEIYR